MKGELAFDQTIVQRLETLGTQIALKIQEFSAAIKVQVSSLGLQRGPDETVRKLYTETRKLRADYLRQLRLLQRSAGVSESEIRAFERARQKELLPDGPDLLWRKEIEQISNAQDTDSLARSALVRITNSIDLTWLQQEAKKTYRLDSSFLENPLHLVNGVRVGTAPRTEGPQRLARMLLVAEDHFKKRMDLDFFSAATLVPELAAFGTSLDAIEALGPEAEKKFAALPSMADEQVSSTIYELLVGAACVRSGLDLTMIAENKSKKVPEYRVNNLHAIPAVLECKRRRGLTDYELNEALSVEHLYGFVRPRLREHGVYGSFEVSFSVPLQRVPPDEFIELINKIAVKPDEEQARCASWGSVAFRSLPYSRSVTETRLYSPEYLDEVFGWGVNQDEWDGILCEVKRLREWMSSYS